jgi:hypothetical protein
MTQPRPLPPLEALREVLAYDPDTGALTWLVGRGKVRAGAPAGCPKGNGYTQVHLGQRRLLAHRLAWYLHHGTDPGQAQVDHINRDRSDNRASNLRLVDAQGNRANSPCPDRPVQVLWPDGQARLLPSVEAAARALSCAPSSVYRYAKGLCQHPAGLVVRYANA